VQFSNVLGAVTAIILQYGDLSGCKVIRRRTLAQYLDAVNFPSGVNAQADPTATFGDDIFFIDQRTVENRNLVEFELAAAFDFQGLQLPRRPIVQNVCVWRYRSAECNYTGTAYFDANDNPVSGAGADVCGKHLSSCKVRFGQYSPLTFGSFPAAGMIRT
jgi:lambda family phage minor tail protein L